MFNLFRKTFALCNVFVFHAVSDPDSKLVSMRVSSSLHSGDIYQVVPALFGYDLFTRPSVSGKLRQATPFDMCTPPEAPLDERIAVVYRRKACTFSKQVICFYSKFKKQHWPYYGNTQACF